MSVVGCSGEDFASILQALGFRRERRKLPAPIPAESVEVEGRQEEIWRPVGRKEPRHPPLKAATGKARRPAGRPDGQQVEDTQTRVQARIKRPNRARPVESSPFAVLAELRRNLAARRPEGG
jgi:ATP-dependent RNA helicase SUPV3L1/SUV3